LDLGIGVIKEGLKVLGGLSRRFQLKGEKNGVLFLDDYGHHPTEIIATLKTVKECWPERRLIVLFQPHRYSRTQALLDRFVLSFNDADILIVAPIFSAGEDTIKGITSETLSKGIKDHGHKEVVFCARQEEILPALLDLVRPGDLIITLGAGNIYREGDRFFEKLGA